MTKNTHLIFAERELRAKERSLGGVFCEQALRWFIFIRQQVQGVLCYYSAFLINFIEVWIKKECHSPGISIIRSDFRGFLILTLVLSTISLNLPDVPLWSI